MIGTMLRVRDEVEGTFSDRKLHSPILNLALR